MAGPEKPAVSRLQLCNLQSALTLSVWGSTALVCHEIPFTHLRTILLTYKASCCCFQPSMLHAKPDMPIVVATGTPHQLLRN